MDPYALLDYALLKLTPTRTRCDLVVVSGGKTEKLASGLVEPFIAHLKFAKDQIPKGGYSIAMRPPSPAASWFTKATFQRFVRFVSTPEILERFMRLEREILQIESSIESNNSSKSSSEEGTPPPKSKGEVDGADITAAKENSKYRLQCLLDTRKALLRKEQAMAYARATVAGFEVEQMDDLVCFANAFGASRLREACIDFMELYKQKHTDCLWMDEVTAMKACSPQELSYLGNSGVILACENSNGLMRSSSLDASSDSKESQLNSEDNNLPASNQMPSTNAQLQMPWPNQIPPYMYNFQGPVQPMPFPGMHPVPPYYPGQMHWAQTLDDSPNGLKNRKHHHKSSRKKEKVSNSDAPESSEDEGITSSNSDSESDSDESGKDGKVHLSRHRKHKKKSSKTVVIRNINYIASKRRDAGSDDSSSLDATSLDENSIKQQVDDAISLLEQGHNKKSHKHSNRGHEDSKNGSNGGVENWDAFQSILMSREDEEKKQDVSFNGEDCMIKNSDAVKRQHVLSDDSVTVTERYGGQNGNGNTIDFANGEDIHLTVKRGGGSEDVQLVLSQNREGSGSRAIGTASDFAAESSSIRNKNGDDWFIANNSGNPEGRQGAKDMIFENGGSLSSDNKSATAIDDSFMIQSRSTSDDQCSSVWKTDIDMDADIITAARPENSDPVVSQASEPNDLCVVLARDPSLDSAEVSWMPELGYEIEASYAGLNKSYPAAEPAEESSPVKGNKKSSKKETTPATKTSARDTKSKLSPGYLSRNKLEALSRSKKMSPTNKLAGQKGKLEREEEERKRMEELVLERQKRIAERTAASGLASPAPRKAPAGSKMASSKLEKQRVPSNSSKVRVSL